MIADETLEKLAKQQRMGVYPSVVQEYFQHLLLSALYKLPAAQPLLFKGGTALRILYGSPRFSEDLDFSLVSTTRREMKPTVENIFVQMLADIEQAGIRVELGKKSNVTSGGYFGMATFRLREYPPVGVALNISARNGRAIRGEVDSVANDFVPTYSVLHLPQRELVEEKVFGALRQRKKPRDYYDLYFIMRKGMLSQNQKKRLAKLRAEIIAAASRIDFRAELGAFLPADQQNIIRNFSKTLAGEMERQLASV